MPSALNLKMSVEAPSKAANGQWPLFDLVEKLPQLDDLFEEDSIIEDTPEPTFSSFPSTTKTGHGRPLKSWVWSMVSLGSRPSISSNGRSVREAF